MFLALLPLTSDLGQASWVTVAIFAGIGLFYPGITTLVTFIANRRTGPAITATIGNLAPLFAVLAAIPLLGEIPGPVQWLGIAAVVIGAMLLSVQGIGGGRDWPLWILLLPLLASVIRGVVHPTAKIGLEHWPDPVAAVAISYVISSVILIAISENPPGGTHTRLNRKGFAWFAVVGLANGGAVLALYGALAAGPVGLVSPLVAGYPVVALILGKILLRGAPIGLQTVAGVVLATAGIIVLVAAS